MDTQIASASVEDFGTIGCANEAMTVPDVAISPTAAVDIGTLPQAPEFQIETGVAVPTTSGPVQTYHYPIGDLAAPVATESGVVYSSFLVAAEDADERGKIVSRLVNQAKKFEKPEQGNRQFRVLRRTAGKDGETRTGVRIWRIA